MKFANTKIELFLTNFILILFFIKIAFAISFIGNIFFGYYKNGSLKSFDKHNQFFLRLKALVEPVLKISMATLLIIIFNPFTDFKIYINEKMSFVFYIFGFMLIFTTIWSLLTQ